MAANIAGMTPEARTALLQALKELQEQGVRFTVTSAARTKAEQAALYRRYLAGDEGIPLAAPPGRSKHETGLAVDLDVHGPIDQALPILRRYGFKWAGKRDPVHFSYVGALEKAPKPVGTFDEEWAAAERAVAPKRAVRPVAPPVETRTFDEEWAAAERAVAPKTPRPWYHTAATVAGKPGDFFRAYYAALAKAGRARGQKGQPLGLREALAEVRRAYGAGAEAFLDTGKAYEPRVFREMLGTTPGTAGSRAAAIADYVADFLWNPGDALTGKVVGTALKLAGKGAARLPTVQRATAAVASKADTFLTETRMGQQVAKVAHGLANVGPEAALKKAVLSPFLRQVSQRQAALSDLSREAAHFAETTAKATRGVSADAVRQALVEASNARVAARAGQITHAAARRITQASAQRVGADVAEVQRLADRTLQEARHVWRGLGAKPMPGGQHAFERQFSERLLRETSGAPANVLRPEVAAAQRGVIGRHLGPIVRAPRRPGVEYRTLEASDAAKFGLQPWQVGKEVPAVLYDMLERVERGSRTFNPQAVLDSGRVRGLKDAYLKGVALIKGGWVRNNPATALWNGVSNLGVAEEAAKMSGATGGEVSAVLGRAMRDAYAWRRTGRPHPDILEARNLTESFSKTFAGDTPSWGRLLGKVPGMKAVGAVVDIPGELFEINELGTKLALYRALRSRVGPVQAAKVVEDVLFNYQDVAPWLKAMDQYGVWVFNTFPTKATGLVMRTAATRPDVLLKYLRVQPARMDATPGSRERFQNLPSYARTPFTLPVGEDYTTAFGKGSPLALPLMAAERAGQAASGAEAPLGAALSFLPSLEGAVGSGVPGAVIGPALNRNVLTGGEVAPEGTPPDVARADIARAIAQGLLPALTPGAGPIPAGRGYERLSAALGMAAPREGRATEPQEVGEAALQALLGAPMISGETPEARQSRLLGEPRTQAVEAQAIIQAALLEAAREPNPYAGRFAQETSQMRLAQEFRKTQGRLKTVVVSAGRMTPDRADRLRKHVLYLRAIQDRMAQLSAGQ